MLLSSNMIRLYKTYGIQKTFDLFSQFGIQGMDFNNDAEEYYTAEHDRAFYTELKNYAEEKGIKICQAHAPFPSVFFDEGKNPRRFEEIVQSMQYAAWLGAPMIVVHPAFHKEWEGNEEELFAFNLNFYQSLIPFARQFGIKIAIENMAKDSVNSTPERFNKLFDALNDSVFTVCFDVGHCLRRNVDPAQAILEIGDRLVNGCTHIHDNSGLKDQHTLPFYGIADWDSIMKSLAQIGYQGDLSYEAFGFLKNVPEPLYESGLEYMVKVGRYLISRFEYYKKNG